MGTHLWNSLTCLLHLTRNDKRHYFSSALPLGFLLFGYTFSFFSSRSLSAVVDGAISFLFFISGVLKGSVISTTLFLMISTA